MEYIASALKAFFAFKAYVMLPMLILLIGLAVRMKVKDVLFATLTLAAGFAGVFVAFNFFVTRIGPAVKAIADIRGLHYPVMDIGWPPLAAITWAWKMAPASIIAIGALNIAMIALRMTKVLYIDIWNYWHLALIGALLHSSGTNPFLSSIAVFLIAAYNFKTAEWSVPYMTRECHIEGVALSPLSVAGLLPYAVAADRFLNLIPGLRRLNLDPSRARSKGTSLLADPMVIGFAVGLFLGILAGYTLKGILEISVEIAAVMFILPRCGEAIGKAMGEVSGALRSKLEVRFSGYKGLSIAMDSEVVMGNPSVVATGLILIPISLGIAFILPGNKVIPLGDLPNLISIMSLIVLVMRGNVIRAVLAGIPLVAAFLLIAGKLAPLFTTLASNTGMDFGAGSSPITAFTDGGNIVRYWFLWLFRGNIIALILIPVVAFLLWLAWRDHRRVSEVLRNLG